MAGTTESPQHPFFSYLITVLSLYESPPQTPPPAYNGPTDWLIEAIERGVHALGTRAIQAEHALQAAVKNPNAFANGFAAMNPQISIAGSVVDGEHPSKRARRDHSVCCD